MCFLFTYVLMFSFCLNCHLKPFFAIFYTFSPSADYNCCCFKILNSHQLKFVEAKENYITKHFRDKDFDIEKVYEIWRIGGRKLEPYKTVIVIKFSLTKKKAYCKIYQPFI